MASEQHPVALRVMRLRKPSLGPTNGITFNAMTVLPGDFAREAYGMKELDESGVNGFGISQLLSLPAAFGEIHLGELFTCYITVFTHNQDSQVSNVRIQADISFLQQQVPLLDNKNEMIQTLSEKRSEFIANYRVTQACVHM